MNVNGSSFHLFLGEDDWARCAVELSGVANPLTDIWSAPVDSEMRSEVPEWRADLSSIAIGRLPEQLASTSGEPQVTGADQRGLAADRHGNIYSVSDDRQSIVVQAAGERTQSRFWPDLRAEQGSGGDTFQDTGTAKDHGAFEAMTVTAGDYLLCVAGGSSVLRFDLVAGGGPEFFEFPDLPELQIDAMDCVVGRDILLLDSRARRLYRANADLRICAVQIEEERMQEFQPEDRSEQRIIAQFAPSVIDLSAIEWPLSVHWLTPNFVVVLAAGNETGCILYLVDINDSSVTTLLECDFDGLGMVLAPDSSSANLRTAMIWSKIGNQVHSVTLTPRGTSWTASAAPELWPIRRFGGRGLVNALGHTFYDSGNPFRWVTAVTKHRCKFGEQSRIITPVLDSKEFQCTWDRIRFDGRIPPGCAIDIEARCFDDAARFDVDPEAGWITQPRAYANGDGAELPVLGLPRLARADGGAKDCWDLLLQSAAGRFIQLRLTLRGDGRQSPAISALRIWYPRFSYSKRFLPQVFSQEPVSGDFTERFLANMEGVNSSLEDRIASARLLFDPQTAPTEALDWLADWFDVALDPSWDDRRRRLFIKHAAKFFGWRGTQSGMLLALALAFDPSIDECDFILPQAPSALSSGIRLVENFRTRTSARNFIKAPGASGAIHSVTDLDGLWQPDEGRQGLIERWARTLGQAEATQEQKRKPFSLDAGDYDDDGWPSFIQRHFGFVPRLGAEYRAAWKQFQELHGETAMLLDLPLDGAEASGALWQQFANQASPNVALWRKFLERRYATVEALNNSWSSDWHTIADIPFFSALPAAVSASFDWLNFEGQFAPIHGAAHRFSVLIPRTGSAFDPAGEAAALQLAKRIITLEKPAHTIFDVRFYWAMNRVGEARVGRDTEIGEGSRAPQLIPSSVLGQTALGTSFAGGPQSAPGGRELLSC